MLDASRQNHDKDNGDVQLNSSVISSDMSIKEMNERQHQLTQENGLFAPIHV